MYERQWMIMGLAAFSAMSCGGDENGKGRHAPAEPVEGNPPCVISADCPNGQHCDLGECIQECNTEDPCTGELTCSPRARCLEPNQEDADPAPTLQHAGTVSADPDVMLLTDADQTFSIKLSSNSAEPVRYRIQLDAPHLSIAAPRGEFTGSTDIAFNVDSASLKGRDVPGSIKIWTTLGNVVVDAPIHVGLTGKYHGSLRYDAASIPLGDARIAVEVIENNGQVSVLLDPESSLLFPQTSVGAATGFGYYEKGQPIELNASQLIESTFGGDRNHFRRDLGRKIRMVVEPASGGNLEGTFEETIHGLFVQPITFGGTVHLQYDPHAGEPSFELTSQPAMPTSATQEYAPLVLSWTQQNTCAALLTAECGATWTSNRVACFAAIETTRYQPLLTAMQRVDRSFTALAASCANTLTASSLTALTAADASNCGVTAPVACALQQAAAGSVADIPNGQAFGRLIAETIAPALLVAQEEVVQALDESFAFNGALAEQQRYDRAITAMGPIATWILQSPVIERLRSLPTEAAIGEAAATGDTSTQNDTYPSARALAKLLTTLSIVDGEQTRIAAISGGAEPDTLRRTAQEHAVLAFLEAATLVEVLRAWGSSPENIAAQFTGVLTPLDSGFAALLQGANAFGIPDGFVPFQFDPEAISKGVNNFEQVLTAAGISVAAYAELEDDYVANARTYENNADALRRELFQIQSGYDSRLADICGSSFDPDAIDRPLDWVLCGKDGTGEAGLLALDIELAQTRLQAAESRIQGMQDKIDIDTNALAQTQGVHADTIQFIDDTGSELNAIAWSEGVISAQQAAIQTASQAQALNFGAPAGMAVINAVLELEKAALGVARQDLQTAQSMRFEEANQEIEFINGMANISKQLIDVAQLRVEMQQDVIGLLQAQLRARNAIDQAVRLHDERGRALAIANLNPANDPAFRVLRDTRALQLLAARARAQQKLFLSARALEYEMNTPIATLGGTVLGARSKLAMSQLDKCLRSIFESYRTNYGTPQTYETSISVRKLLGILGPRTDEVTGEDLSEGQQFRQLLLRNENLDGKGGVGIVFSSNLQPGNGLWATDVCSDRVTAVQAELVGDFLGDNQAQVNLSLSGAGVMRDCGSDALHSWSFGSESPGAGTAFAVVQAGVNSRGTAPPNNSLFGQSVARASWQIVIPGGQEAPANNDLDLLQIEDIVLHIAHEANPKRDTALPIDASCLAGIR